MDEKSKPAQPGGSAEDTAVKQPLEAMVPTEQGANDKADINTPAKEGGTGDEGLAGLRSDEKTDGFTGGQVAYTPADYQPPQGVLPPARPVWPVGVPGMMQPIPPQKSRAGLVAAIVVPLAVLLLVTILGNVAATVWWRAYTTGRNWQTTETRPGGGETTEWPEQEEMPPLQPGVRPGAFVAGSFGETAAQADKIQDAMSYEQYGETYIAFSNGVLLACGDAELSYYEPAAGGLYYYACFNYVEGVGGYLYRFDAAGDSLFVAERVLTFDASPTGAYLFYYVQDEDGAGAYYRLGEDQTDPEEVAFGLLAPTDAVFSPNGEQGLFLQDGNLYCWPGNASEAASVVQDAGYDALPIGISNDGTMRCYLLGGNLDGYTGEQANFVIDDLAAEEKIEVSLGYTFQATFNRTGDEMVFCTFEKIYRYHAGGALEEAAGQWTTVVERGKYRPIDGEDTYYAVSYVSAAATLDEVYFYTDVEENARGVWGHTVWYWPANEEPVEVLFCLSYEAVVIGEDGAVVTGIDAATEELVQLRLQADGSFTRSVLAGQVVEFGVSDDGQVAFCAAATGEVDKHEDKETPLYRLLRVGADGTSEVLAEAMYAANGAGLPNLSVSPDGKSCIFRAFGEDNLQYNYLYREGQETAVLCQRYPYIENDWALTNDCVFFYVTPYIMQNGDEPQAVFLFDGTRVVTVAEEI